MSEEITIEKTIEVELDGNTIELKKEIKVQIDYVGCDNCGSEIEFEIQKDAFGDLQIMIDHHKCD